MANPQHLAIDAYLQELRDLAEKRVEINRRTERVEKAVRAMIDLLDGEPEYESYLERLDDVVRPAGLTSAITALLQAAGDFGLTPVEIRDQIGSLLSGHSNPTASVHTIIKRLVKTGNFEPVEKNGKPAYRWIRPMSPGEMHVQDLAKRAAGAGMLKPRRVFGGGIKK